MVYIDPPYGIKYNSNFQPFVNKTMVKDKVEGSIQEAHACLQQDSIPESNGDCDYCAYVNEVGEIGLIYEL